jgi:ribosome biogenesis protein Tsr3
LECTNERCTAGEGGAKFKTPALAPAQAIAYLGLHSEAAHGQHGAAAGVGAERVHHSKIPRPEDQQVMAPEAQQVLTPEAQQVLAPADKQVLALEAKQVLAPEAQQVLAPEAQQVLASEAKQVLAPAAKQVLAPEAQQVLAQETQPASEKTTAGTDAFTINTMKISEKSGDISKVSQSIQNMMKYGMRRRAGTLSLDCQRG